MNATNTMMLGCPRCRSTLAQEIGEGKVVCLTCGNEYGGAEGFSVQEQGPAVGGADPGRTEQEQASAQALLAAARTAPQDRSHSNGRQTSAAGLATIVFPFVEAGYRHRVKRFVIESPAYTPAAPYVAAGGYLILYRNAAATGNMVDFAPQLAGAQSIPKVADYPGNVGPVLREGERLVCVFTGGPASTQLVCRYDYMLEILGT